MEVLKRYSEYTEKTVQKKTKEKVKKMTNYGCCVTKSDEKWL